MHFANMIAFMQLKTGLSARRGSRPSNDLHYNVCGVRVHSYARMCT